jgi:hypothetical protein
MNNFETQMDISEVTQEKQNVAFEDNALGEDNVISSEPDPSYLSVPNPNALLGEFLSRPVKIKQIAWNPSTTLFETFNPWDLFFTNVRIINKIAGFSLVRSKLRVKFTINGNPFYYGRVIATYSPLPSADKLYVNRSIADEDLVRISQLPHVFLNPTDCSAGEFELPFFWYNSYLSIVNEDWNRLGTINLRSLGTLEHANGGLDPINVSVFAWAEDVELSMPTQDNPGSIGPQSGKGPISKAASSMASIAGKMKDIPVIGSYATAGETIGNAVSDIASALGYCRPLQSDIPHYRPAYTGSVANTNSPDSSIPLSVDFNQQVTIDPCTTGLGSEDEMALSNIWSKESYMCTFPFNPDDTSETRLFCTVVDPGIQRSRTTGDGTTAREMHKTSCAFATLPFRSWRGSMKFRFQVISSAYHRGRIKVVFDPSFSQTTAEYNTTYTRIIDISEETDFTVTIGWAQAQQYRRILHNQFDSDYFRTDGSKTPFGPTLDYGNGELSVYVVNSLTSPNDTVSQNVRVAVYVSCGDDFEVMNPLNNNVRYMTPISDYETQAGKDSPEHDNSQILVPISDAGNVGSICKGEQYLSIRNLIKRYSFGNYLSGIGNSDTENRCVYTAPAFPMHYGRTQFGPFDNARTSTYGKNFGAITTLLGYYSVAFAGMRGSVRIKVASFGQNGAETEKMTCITSRNVSTTTASYLSYGMPNTTVSARSNYMAENMICGIDGMAFTPGKFQNVNEVQIPYYSELRFLSPRILNWYTANNTTDLSFAGVYPAFQHETFMMAGQADSANSDRYTLIAYAAGDDFALFFYQGPPVLYEYTDAYTSV